jgi:acyl-CoA hydrolase
VPGQTDEVVLRFLAAPTDVGYAGAVVGGRVLEWIDKAGYACAVGWSGRYCVTAYVGDVRLTRQVESGHLVEVRAHLVHSGRTSMHVRVAVSSADPQRGHYQDATECLMVFVAVDGDGSPTPVPPWSPRDEEGARRQQDVVRRVELRREIERLMAAQRYTDDTTAPRVVLRFLAAPGDVNWGGKVHGGTVMRWIDEAAYVCAGQWVPGPRIASYAGGVRFYRPLLIGHVVEVEARMIHTGPTSAHLSVHVRSGPPTTGVRELTTHCLIVFTALDADGREHAVAPWRPETREDRALDAHARDLVALRGPATG